MFVSLFFEPLIHLHKSWFIIATFLRVCDAVCRDRAEGVKAQANSTRQALDMSEKAIKKAAEALKEAEANLNSTRNATAEVGLTHSAASEELSIIRLS